MNAYELADDLEQAANLEMELDRPENWADLKNAAEIIRQLATEKAELEKLVHQRFDDGKRLGILDTELKYKFAPQTKPLSDEEIISIADSLSLIHYYDSDGEWSGITNEPMFRVEENRNNERLLEILKPFARAIEAKVRGQ